MMDLQLVITLLTKVTGFVTTLCFVYIVLKKSDGLLDVFITDLVGNNKLTIKGIQLVVILIGLEGVKAALSFINQPELKQITDGLSSLAGGLAGVVQWVIPVSVLYLIGSRIRSLI